MADYTNPHKPKEREKKDVQKVVTGKVIKKKKGVVEKAAENFISEDVDDVKDYVLHKVFIPNLKDTLFDMLTGGLGMLLGVNSRSSGSSYRNYNSGRTSYDRYYDKDPRNRDKDRSRNRERYSYDDVVLDTRAAAENVIDGLLRLTDEYGMASVADLYSLVGFPSNYIDDKWGWYDLSTAGVKRVSDGYLIVLPRTQSLD